MRDVKIEVRLCRSMTKPSVLRVVADEIQAVLERHPHCAYSFSYDGEDVLIDTTQFATTPIRKKRASAHRS